MLRVAGLSAPPLAGRLPWWSGFNVGTVRRGWLGRVRRVQVEARGLQLPDTSFQLGDAGLVSGNHGQYRGLGFRSDRVPQFCGYWRWSRHTRFIPEVAISRYPAYRPRERLQFAPS